MQNIITYGVNKNIVLTNDTIDFSKYSKVLSKQEFLTEVNNNVEYKGDGVDVFNSKNEKILVIEKEGKYINGQTYYLSDKEFHSSQYFPKPPSFKPERTEDSSFKPLFHTMLRNRDDIAAMLKQIPAGVLLDLLSEHNDDTFYGFCFLPNDTVGAF